jgi:hypothetical protein
VAEPNDTEVELTPDEPVQSSETPVEAAAEDAVAGSVSEETPARDADDDVLDRLLGAEERKEEPAPVAPDADLDRAYQILKRDGVPENILKTVSKDTLIAWSAKAGKRQSDVDGYGKRMKALESENAQLKSGRQQQAEDETFDEESEPEAAAEATDRDEVESDETEDSRIKALSSEVSQLRLQQQEQQMRTLQTQVEQAITFVQGQYGNKAVDSQAVLNEMDRLGRAKPGTFPTMIHLAQEAFANLAGPVADPRRVGQPTARPTVGRSERPTTPSDTEDAVLEALLDGRDVTEARRLTRK